MVLLVEIPHRLERQDMTASLGVYAEKDKVHLLTYKQASENLGKYYAISLGNANGTNLLLTLSREQYHELFGLMNKVLEKDAIEEREADRRAQDDHDRLLEGERA
jgi:uncharacterized lipoprotein YehR (DUF1307 family)